MTTEELLAEAELAYHKLLTGRSMVEFRDQNGELMRYTQPSATRLAAYIQQLKTQLGVSSAGPMRVFF